MLVVIVDCDWLESSTVFCVVGLFVGSFSHECAVRFSREPLSRRGGFGCMSVSLYGMLWMHVHCSVFDYSRCGACRQVIPAVWDESRLFLGCVMSRVTCVDTAQA